MRTEKRDSAWYFGMFLRVVFIAGVLYALDVITGTEAAMLQAGLIN